MSSLTAAIGENSIEPAKAKRTSGMAPGQASHALFTRARELFPDGTARITIDRDPIPRYLACGEGAYVVDVDGNRFLDLNGNFTTLIHGHGFLPVVEAVTQQLRSGTCFANPTEAEIGLASLLRARLQRLEHLRFVNSGTEAVMFAIKAARAFTGRPAIAKIEGAYHGAYDWAEVAQGGTRETWGDPDAPASVPTYRGMPGSVSDDVVALRFNDADGARRRLTEHAGRLAAILVDPMPSRAGLLVPTPEFIEAIQETARAHGILVISDEVLNFRQGFAGASVRYGLEPDLITLGKIIGGGFPVGAVGGRGDVMEVFDASRGQPPLPQGGTFSANPISMVAGQAAMTALDPAAFDRLEALGSRLRTRLGEVADQRGAAFCVTGAASLFRIHPRRLPPGDFREACWTQQEAATMQALKQFFRDRGIILPHGAAACISTPVTETDIDIVVDVFDAFLTGGKTKREAP